MKIARIESEGQIYHAAIEDGNYNIIDGCIFGISELSGNIIPASKAKLLSPVAEPKQLIAIGANYKKHIAECNAETPDAPLVFIKASTAVTGPDCDIVLPKIAPDCVDYEAELAIVIGKDAKNVSEQDADKYILGYTCANDVSARDCQLKIDKQWARGKSFDSFAPLGPYIATRVDGDNLKIKLTLNGEVMQNSSTSDMLFGCRYLVSYLSQCMTLKAGSVILTGTPSGVGMALEPQRYLRQGDKVCVEIENIGTLCNNVVKE